VILPPSGGFEFVLIVYVGVGEVEQPKTNRVRKNIDILIILLTEF
jgi:hypothetical protein